MPLLIGDNLRERMDAKLGLTQPERNWIHLYLSWFRVSTEWTLGCRFRGTALARFIFCAFAHLFDGNFSFDDTGLSFRWQRAQQKHIYVYVAERQLTVSWLNSLIKAVLLSHRKDSIWSVLRTLYIITCTLYYSFHFFSCRLNVRYTIIKIASVPFILNLQNFKVLIFFDFPMSFRDSYNSWEDFLNCRSSRFWKIREMKDVMVRRRCDRYGETWAGGVS